MPPRRVLLLFMKEWDEAALARLAPRYAFEFAGSRAGNRTTAVRWARMLRALGHRVEIATAYTGEKAEVMIALHAWRCAASIARFAEVWPQRPLIVVITGTDAYRFLAEDPLTTRRSLDLAHRLVGLHASIGDALPPAYHAKLRVIFQSAPAGLARRPYRRGLRICVAGRLRAEKDPLRPAWAVRYLPETSPIRVDHYGSAHDREWAAAAQAEMACNPRYHWHGQVSPGRLRRVLAHAHLLVLPSRMEGGANIVSEAVMAGLPVIASRIPGSVGLLGEDYPGYFPVADTPRPCAHCCCARRPRRPCLPSCRRPVPPVAPCSRQNANRPPWQPCWTNCGRADRGGPRTETTRNRSWPNSCP